jgi:ribosomal protein S18 acetylase RimI-like enzyme
MCVDTTYQRQGYGERIFLALETAAREQGFERIVLDTTDRQTAAKTFYRKHGCEETTREQFHEFEVVRFEKRLE